MSATLIKLALGAAVALGVGWCARDRSEREGRWRERERQLLAALDSATARAARTDTVYARDTVRYAVQRTRWDTIRVRDTVVVDGVVYVERAAADTVLKACERTLGSCEAARAAVAAERDQWRTLAEHRADDPRRRRFWDRLGISGGYGITATLDGNVYHGVQLGAHVRLYP